MLMDASKKERLEQRAVIGLIGVFLLVFATGPLKRMGWFAGGHAPAGVVGVAMNGMGATPSGDPTHSVQHGGVSSAEAVQPSSVVPALYTAHELRDPMRNTLPVAQAQAVQPEAQLSQSAAHGEQPKPPRPALQIQGIVWGGSAPKAIINGRIYGVNDLVDTRRIVAIEQGGVTVADDESAVLYPVMNLLLGSTDLLSQQAQWR